MQSVASKIEKKIEKKGRGKIYFASDFASLGSSEAIRKTLLRLEQSEMLIRIARGIYLYPKVEEALGLGILYPTVEEVAKEIAGRDKARIVPTGLYQIAELHNSKRNYYTENTIYPALRFEDFKESLFPKVRNLIKSNNPEHPWLTLNDRELLNIAGLWKQDYQTSREGYTLAAALLFGKDEVIQSIIPHYKIDAIVRIDNVNRYDDREYIQANLIEAYELLMDFTAKHLPDKFYLEGGQRVSLRTKIFREVIANLIVHREYTNAFPCRFIIYSNRVETENASNPKHYGRIDPKSFTPYPKNPTLAKFFIQLGRVEELGSGVLNVSKLAKEYSNGGEASFIEGDIFKMIIPTNLKNDAVNDAVNKRIIKSLNNSVINTLINTVISI